MGNDRVEDRLSSRTRWARVMVCSHLAVQGATMRGVQELLGRQSPAMTQRCSHLSPTALDAMIRLLEQRPAHWAVGDSLETPNGSNA
jgi:hypothetical protein